MLSRVAPAASRSNRFKAVTFDAYGTLLRNEDLMLIPRRLVADHRLPVEALEVLHALAHLPSGIVSNADREHLAAWHVELPVRFILISETVQAYKPDPRMFTSALEQFGLQPHEVLHVGDSEVDDVKGAKAAGLSVVWVNRDGRPRRTDGPAPDFEIPDLTGLPALV